MSRCSLELAVKTIKKLSETLRDSVAARALQQSVLTKIDLRCPASTMGSPD